MTSAPFMLAAAGHGADGVSTMLITLVLVLLGAKLAGDVAIRLGLPAVLGELLVGVLLGNLTLLGGPDLHALVANPAFEVMAELGAILLLFQVGLESTPREMLAVGGRATMVAVVGVVTPMALGFGVGELMMPQDSWMLHAFFGRDAGGHQRGHHGARAGRRRRRQDATGAHHPGGGGNR